MTRNQFLAYERARQLEKYVQPANDNSKIEAWRIYGKGVADGIILLGIIFLLMFLLCV